MHGSQATDWAIARLAARQHGVVSRTQLLALGINRGAIARRVRSGRLHPVHRGVYLTGHTAAPPRAREMGAVLACGDRAAVSHRSAAALWQLLPYPAKSAVDITVARSRAPQRPGIRVRRTSSLSRRDVRRLDGIPVTSPARTLLDLAAEVGAVELERAVAEALARSLVGRRELLNQLARNRGRRGTAPLRTLLEANGGPARTRSEAERRFLALVRRADLPGAETNVKLGPYEVDFLWREERLVVEVDGYAFHSDRPAFERDRLRDAELQARGFHVIRVTWRQLTGTPEAVLARIVRALALAGAQR